jgi:hypothetical protein
MMRDFLRECHYPGSRSRSPQSGRRARIDGLMRL